MICSDVCFLLKKTPPEAEHAEGLAQGSGSLVVRSTDVGPNIFQNNCTFPIIVFAPKQIHINDGELLNNVPCRAFRCACVHVFLKPHISKVSANIELHVYNTNKCAYF